MGEKGRKKGKGNMGEKRGRKERESRKRGSWREGKEDWVYIYRLFYF